MSENTSKQTLLPGYNTILGHILYKFKDLLDKESSIDGEDISSSEISSKFFLYIKPNSNTGPFTTQELKLINLNVDGTPSKKYFIKLGTLLRIFQDLIYISDKNKPISTFDFEYDSNFCFNPAHKLISLDTNICVVPSSTFDDKTIGNKLNYLNNSNEIDQDFIDDNREENRKDKGNTMHILLNIDMLLEVLNTTVDNKISIYDFMSSVLTNINNSFANITSLSFIYDIDTNTYQIIDENIPGNSIDPSRINVGILKTQQGNGSFVKNISLNSQLSPNIASQIAIGAQATTGGGRVPQESLAFSSWNVGAIDRIIPTKDVKDQNDPTVDSKMGKEDWEALKNFLQNLQYWSPQSTSYVSSFLPVYKKYISTEFKTQPFSSFIPINLSIEMEGISGIKIYQKYSITEEYLPKVYKDKIEFLTKGVSHTINTKEWNTTIDGFTIPKIPNLEASNQQSQIQKAPNNKIPQSNFTGDTPNADALRNVLTNLGYSEKIKGQEYKNGPIVDGPQLSNGGDITTELENFASTVFRKIKEVYPGIKITVSGGNDAYHQNLDYNSSHISGNGLDFVISPDSTENKNKVDLILLGYVANPKNRSIWFINEYESPTFKASGGHFHIRVAGKDKSGKEKIEQALLNDNLIRYDLT